MAFEGADERQERGRGGSGSSFETTARRLATEIKCTNPKPVMRSLTTLGSVLVTVTGA
jgi:hypothetical protein